MKFYPSKKGGFFLLSLALEELPPYSLLLVLSGGKFQNTKEEEGVMNCLYCGGDMERQEVAYIVDRKDYHLFLEKIPTLVCTKCGERAYEEKEVNAIQDMIAKFEEGITRVREVV